MYIHYAIQISNANLSGSQQELINFTNTATSGEDEASVTVPVLFEEKEIEEILRKRHNLGKMQENDFQIRNSAEFQEKMKSTVKTFAILLASIASVSLIVGGIGIMNVLFVSVKERTNEIGILKAIGCSRKDILLEFLLVVDLLQNKD